MSPTPNKEFAENGLSGITAVVFAGGRGTRLAPLTDNLPKPMVEIDGKPFLEHLLLRLKAKGITRFVLSVGYLKEKIIEYFGNGSKLGVAIEYAVDEQQGTAVALKKAAELVASGEAFFALNGDTLVEFDAGAMLESYLQGNCECVVAVKQGSEQENNLEIVGGKIVSYGKKNKLGKNFTNCGVFLLSKKCVSLVDASQATFEEPLFAELIKSGQIKAFEVENCFDLGTMEGLQVMRQVLASK